MKKPEVKSGLLSAQTAVDRGVKMTKEELARQIAKWRDRDEEKVTGIFKNLENPAVGGSKGMVQFSYKMYPGQPNEVYELWDGERYSLPRGVARHLNNNCFYREYQHLKGEFGQQGIRAAASDGKLQTQSMQISKKVNRYAFHSLEYMDDDLDMNPSTLLEVTLTP
jgi:hypothetical protein